MPRKNQPKRRHATPYIVPLTPGVMSAPYLVCRQKRRFPSQKQAYYAAETGMLQNMHIVLDVYQCELCQGWHLTSKQPT